LLLLSLLEEYGGARQAEGPQSRRTPLAVNQSSWTFFFLFPPPREKPLVVNVVIVVLFEKEAERIGKASNGARGKQSNQGRVLVSAIEVYVVVDGAKSEIKVGRRCGHE